ncbi:MAG: AI-2E family transporter [Actinomycetota bacterium]
MPEGAPARSLSAGLIAKAVLVTAAVIAGLFLLYQLSQVIGLVLIAVFFALAIAPPVNWLDNRGTPRWLAIILVYLAIAGAIFGIGLLVVPPMVNGVEALSNDLPGYVDDLRKNDTFRDYDDKYDITGKLTQQAEDLPTKLGDAAGTLRDVTVGVFSRFVQLFSILVITFFLLMDGPRILEFFYRQLPAQREARMRTVANDIGDAVSGYVFGAFVIATLSGLMTYVTLTIINVPFAVPLAVLVGFFGLIPLVGATIGGILVGIVVAFVSFPGGLIAWVIVLVVYQQIENNLFQPYIYGQTLQVHPLAVIVAVLIGASLLGILGALLAIPGAAVVQAIVRDWWRFGHGEEATRAVAGADSPGPSGAPGPA